MNPRMSKEDRERLEYMSGPDSHEKWDLSENDRSAIRAALAELGAVREECEKLTERMGFWGDEYIKENKKRIQVESDFDQLRAENLQMREVIEYLGNGVERNPNIYIAMDKAMRICLDPSATSLLARRWEAMEKVVEAARHFSCKAASPVEKGAGLISILCALERLDALENEK